MGVLGLWQETIERHLGFGQGLVNPLDRHPAVGLQVRRPIDWPIAAAPKAILVGQNRLDSAGFIHAGQYNESVPGREVGGQGTELLWGERAL